MFEVLMNDSVEWLTGPWLHPDCTDKCQGARAPWGPGRGPGGAQEGPGRGPGGAREAPGGPRHLRLPKNH